jgi:hypothetical protein
MDASNVDGPPSPRGAELVESLQRWEDSGAVWKVLQRQGDKVTIGMFRCDGGEEVDRFTSDARDVVDFVSGRPVHPD